MAAVCQNPTPAVREMASSWLRAATISSRLALANSVATVVMSGPGAAASDLYDLIETKEENWTGRETKSRLARQVQRLVLFKKNEPQMFIRD
jgi:hypothetical protein